ncbi:MAG: molybdenum cofactor biosynthesis protein MoaE [Bacteroidales bacterium]|nr:molybdenum cofactor biosynthesis protein MoaE [Bacteroidales bacterium]
MSNNILIPGPVTHDLITAYLNAISNRTDAGGHSCFIGQVRADNIAGKRVKAIEYSAYEKMVRPEADQIINMILSEFDDVKSIDILHSVGIVKAGEISLFVLVSAGHRHHAIQACSKTVELIKEKLPVWKKEIFNDNSHEWKQNNLA